MLQILHSKMVLSVAHTWQGRGERIKGQNPSPKISSFIEFFNQVLQII